MSASNGLVEEFAYVGKVLRAHRRKAGLKQKEVAKELGYSSPQFISNWERGISRPPNKTLSIVCDMYGVDKKKLVRKMIVLYEKRLKEEVLNV